MGKIKQNKKSLNKKIGKKSKEFNTKFTQAKGRCNSMNMKIVKGVQDSYKLHANGSAINTSKNDDAQTLVTKNKPQNMNVDKINISPKGSFQTKLNSEIKKYAQAANTKENTSAKISELKLKYNNNNCPVSGADIASSMMKNICGIKNID